MNQDIHIPVLKREVIELLSPVDGQEYLDLTAGYGGHAEPIVESIGDKGRAVLIDRDSNAVKHLTALFKGQSNISIYHQDYYASSQELYDSTKRFDMILADIGVSSPHLDNPDRGFSFMNDGPLDMRMDSRTERTAADIVNTVSEAELADLLYTYGELHSSRRLAKTIIEKKPYYSTSELAAVIPGNYKTRMRTLAQVFQSLRIVVNDELGQLERSLPLWLQLLKPGGRLAVITFHSLEDRLVKDYFSEHSADVYGSEFMLLTKRPVVAKPDEIDFNPRARSSKLRVVQRK